MSLHQYNTTGERNDAILTSRGIPLSFGSWRYSSWSKTQLRNALTLLGGNARDNTKLNLYSRLHRHQPASSPLSGNELDRLRVSRQQREFSLSPVTSCNTSLTSTSASPADTANYDVFHPSLSSAKRDGNGSDMWSMLYLPQSGGVIGKRLATPCNNNDSRSSWPYATPPSSPPDVPHQPQTCEVCDDGILHDTRLTKAITRTCMHGPEISICRTCVEHYIHVSITTNGWGNITCPVTNCREILTYNDMHNAASAADFQRYDTYLLHQVLDRDSSGTYQRCAHEDCLGGGWCDPMQVSFMSCPSCTRLTCIGCSKIYHTGKTCAEYAEDNRRFMEAEASASAERAATEAEDAKYVKAKYRACPKKECGYRIEKGGGCDHMTCRKCQYQFCWICLADYNEVLRVGNTAHLKSCKYHSRRLRI